MHTTAIIFDGGFGLAVNSDQLVHAIRYGSHLKLKDFSTVEEAYMYACFKHCQREFYTAPYKQIYLPKLTDMLNGQVFYTPTFVPDATPAYRIFAAVNAYSVAVLNNIDAMIAFTQQIQNFKIKEVSNLYEAQCYIDFQFLKYILPFGAYIKEPIPRCPQIPLNTIVQLQFVQWVQTHKISENIPANILNARTGNLSLNPSSNAKNSDYENGLLNLIDKAPKTIDLSNLMEPMQK